MKTLVGAALAAVIALPAFAENHAEIKPERRALLISIIEDLGCKMDGATPPQAFLDKMEEHKFVKDETKAIAGQMFADGTAVREGSMLVLKTEKCS